MCSKPFGHLLPNWCLIEILREKEELDKISTRDVSESSEVRDSKESSDILANSECTDEEIDFTNSKK